MEASVLEHGATRLRLRLKVELPSQTQKQGMSNSSNLAKENKMAIADDIAEFANELRKQSDITKAEVSTFPSGGVTLDVWVGRRMFVLHYLPSYKMFGVDEVKDDEGLGTNYRFGFDAFTAAKAKLLNLIEESEEKAK
jgi:hypothetical protein